MKLEDLKNPFPTSDIEWRVQQGGIKNGKPWAMVLAYVTNRAIMDRLDEVCGPENWKNEFKPAPESGVLCGISIRFGDEWVTKWDGAENTQIEAVKGGLSSAMKRAGSQWGIGRYLYNLDATWAKFSDNGKHTAKIEGKYFKWDDPDLPKWALPEKANLNSDGFDTSKGYSVERWTPKVLEKEVLTFKTEGEFADFQSRQADNIDKDLGARAEKFWIWFQEQREKVDVPL